MILAIESPEYVKELAQHHTGGYLKIAPEALAEGPLSKMMKPHASSSIPGTEYGMGRYEIRIRVLSYSGFRVAVEQLLDSARSRNSGSSSFDSGPSASASARSSGTAV